MSAHATSTPRGGEVASSLLEAGEGAWRRAGAVIDIALNPELRPLIRSLRDHLLPLAVEKAGDRT